MPIGEEERIIMERRITIRFNEAEAAEIQLLKETFHVEKDSEAVKLAVQWVNHYLKNVTITFFPPDYDVLLSRKRKTNPISRRVY